MQKCVLLSFYNLNGNDNGDGNSIIEIVGI